MSTANDQWYIRHFDGVVHGPYSLDSLVDGARADNVAADSVVMHAQHTKGQWIQASQVQRILTAMNAANGEPSIQPRASRPKAASNKVGAGASPGAEVNVKAVRRSYGRRDMIVPKSLTEAFFALFDFRFKYFITPWIVRMQWALFVSFVLGAIAIVLFTFVISPLMELMPESRGVSPAAEVAPATRSRPTWEFNPPALLRNQAARVFAICSFLGACAAALLYVRLLLESVIVFFRIAEDLTAVREIAEKR